MSLDVWPAGLIADNKKGQGRIGLAPLDDVLFQQAASANALIYRLPPWTVFSGGFADQLVWQSAEPVPGCLRHLFGAAVTALFHS